MILKVTRNGLPRCARNDGKRTSSSEYSSLRGVAKQQRGNPFLVLIVILFLSFLPCQAAIELDGVDDYLITENTNWQFTGDFTISYWVKFDTYNSYQNPISTTDDGNATNGFWTEFGSTRGFTMYSTGTQLVLTDNILNLTALSTGSWHHVLITRNGSGANNVKGYLDNTLFGQNTFTTSIGSVTEPLMIGKYAANAALWFLDGSVDDIRFYNRSFSINEIEILYNSRSKRPSGSLANGLIAHYEMDDDAIGEVAAQAKDSSGNMNHGEFIGFDNIVSNGFSNDVPAQIGTGTSLVFDGVDDYIEVSDNNNLDITGNMTMTMWIQGNDTSNKVLTEKGINQSLLLQPNGDNIFYFYNGVSPSTVPSISSDILNNNWNLLTFSFDGTNKRLYVNGLLRDNIATTAVTANSDTFVLGARSGGAAAFTGSINAIRIYNRSLSNGEISYLFNGSGLNPGTSNLQALWAFDDSALKDSSGNDNHGVGIGGDSLKYTEGVLKR